MASIENSGSEEATTKPSLSGRVGSTTPRGQESVVPSLKSKCRDATCKANKKMVTLRLMVIDGAREKIGRRDKT